MWKRRTNRKSKNRIFICTIDARILQCERWMCAQKGFKFQHFHTFYLNVPYAACGLPDTVVAEMKTEYISHVSRVVKPLWRCCCCDFAYFSVFRVRACVCDVHGCQSEKLYTLHFDRMLQFQLHTSASQFITDSGNYLITDLVECIFCSFCLNCDSFRFCSSSIKRTLDIGRVISDHDQDRNQNVTRRNGINFDYSCSLSFGRKTQSHARAQKDYPCRCDPTICLCPSSYSVNRKSLHCQQHFY